MSVVGLYIYILYFLLFICSGTGYHDQYSDSATGWMVLGSYPGRDNRLFTSPKVQNSSKAHPVFYIGLQVFFPEIKAAGS